MTPVLDSLCRMIRMIRMIRRPPIVLLLLLSTSFAISPLAGCSQPRTDQGRASGPAGPEYARPLPPGRSALRRVTDPARLPDLAAAYAAHDALLLEAIGHSIGWFGKPSSHQFFPMEGVTHEQARASVVAALAMLERAPDTATFIADFTRMFDVYESVGYDGQGTVLYTGYYAPILRASRAPSSRYAFPLYRRPADLVTDPVTGAPKGQRRGAGTAPYPTRREIETKGLLRGQELVWLEDALSAYLVHVNGSAKLRMTEGDIMYVGYAGKTDRPYGSLGKAMIAAGLVDADSVSLSAIQRVFRRQPERVRELMYENENYVFFTEYAPDAWPAGSLGVRVTAESSLATDKSIYPRGGLVLVDTDAVSPSQGRQPFLRFMLDQDTGGAIRAPGRADLFMGVGPGAEVVAGGQHAEGRLYYFFLKPRYVGMF